MENSTSTQTATAKTNYLINVKAQFLIRENGWYCQLICPKTGKVLVDSWQYLTRFQFAQGSWGKFEFTDKEGLHRTDWKWDCDGATEGWFDVRNSKLDYKEVWEYAKNINRLESALKKEITVKFTDNSEKNFNVEKPFNGTTFGMGGYIYVQEGKIFKLYDNGRKVEYENIFVIDNLAVAQASQAIADCIKYQWLKRIRPNKHK